LASCYFPNSAPNIRPNQTFQGTGHVIDMLCHGLPTVTRNLTEGLSKCYKRHTSSGRPPVGATGSVGRPYHNAATMRFRPNTIGAIPDGNHAYVADPCRMHRVARLFFL
jgi:hypothetical protein